MKYSRQREIVKKALAGRTDHPTAEDIYQVVHKIDANISLATVYRNLNLLSDMGEISRVSFCGASDRFEERTDEHFHHVCTKCGKVQDLTIKAPFGKMDDLIKQETGAKVDKHDLIAYGVCKECQQE